MKVALIGGTGGIGALLTQYLTDKKFDCISVGSGLCDVTNDKKVKEFIDKEKPEVIIYLSVNNIDGLIHKQTEETTDYQLEVNLKGFMRILRHATPHMREASFGRIIYISSILSTNPIIGTGIYSASKAFGDTIVKVHSLENAKYGITTNSIQLGYFDAGLTNRVPEKVMNEVIKKIPLKRLGDVVELADLVEVMIKTEYINGAQIALSGGHANS